MYPLVRVCYSVGMSTDTSPDVCFAPRLYPMYSKPPSIPSFCGKLKGHAVHDQACDDLDQHPFVSLDQARRALSGEGSMSDVVNTMSGLQQQLDTLARMVEDIVSAPAKKDPVPGIILDLARMEDDIPTLARSMIDHERRGHGPSDKAEEQGSDMLRKALGEARDRQATEGCTFALAGGPCGLPADDTAHKPHIERHPIGGSCGSYQCHQYRPPVQDVDALLDVFVVQDRDRLVSGIGYRTGRVNGYASLDAADPKALSNALRGLLVMFARDVQGGRL